MKRTIYLLAVIMVCAMLAGCRTVKETSSTYDHRITDMMERVDSLIRMKSVVQQDSAWRATIMKQFESIREKSDTSHYVVTDTTGKVIKEKIVINNVREVTSERDRQQIQVLSHRLEVMDSTMNLMSQRIQHSDSLLQAKEKTVTTTVTSPLTMWQQVQLWLGRLAIVALVLIVAVWFLKKKFKLW